MEYAGGEAGYFRSGSTEAVEVADLPAKAAHSGALEIFACSE